MAESAVHQHGLDKEWLFLILEAKKIGLSKEEVKIFLQEGNGCSFLCKES
ncbi:anti-repressor SinI family protein [Bacillaceae bacterium Marseille-Q3522]|nr:anti-repressor SinI family protein [Bacillaceae bacterium Marseille-Q3522]